MSARIVLVPGFWLGAWKPHKYWYIVEREGSPDPGQTARGAHEHLSTLTA